MNDDPIGGLIRSLPRAEPSRGFTRRVMDRIDGQAGMRPSPTLRRTWAAAIALTVVVSLGGGAVWRQQREARRLEAMKAETARIRAELDSMRAQARQDKEIYLGQSGDREYVLDLRQFTAPNTEVRPVSQTY